MFSLFSFIGGMVIGIIILLIVLFFVYRNNKCRFEAIEAIAKKGNAMTTTDIVKIYNLATGKETCDPCASGKCG
jgi:hypothetical protein